MNETLKVGDVVQIECDSALGTGGPSKITKITTKYDEDTGKPYKVLWCGNRGFSAKHGYAITSPFAYYIDF
jgi:hypothetical protein